MALTAKKLIGCWDCIEAGGLLKHSALVALHSRRPAADIIRPGTHRVVDKRVTAVALAPHLLSIALHLQADLQAQDSSDRATHSCK